MMFGEWDTKTLMCVDRNKEDSEALSTKLAESESLTKKLDFEKIELANALERTKEEHINSKGEHENGMQTLKAELYDAMDDYKKNVAAMEKKNASLEEELQKLRASLKDHERRRVGMIVFFQGTTSP
jgi:chromosome segregation ATPase